MNSRHRSIASMSAQSRPASRASTTSAASQHHDPSFLLQSDAKFDGPEAALLQYQASIAPHPSRSFDMSQGHVQQMMQSQNGSLQQYGVQNAYFPHDQQSQQQQHHQPRQVQMQHQHQQFLMQDSTPQPHQVRLGSVSAKSGSEIPEDKKKKTSAVTATNDKELREMLAKNETRPLREVAQEVIQKERTPMAEKTKQLFAMLWLRAVCKPAKTSVPRNRVYSQYASRCGTERVVPLNPASFGKLVRVIFPGIQTRRLGVRGESKYHYVDLALEDEAASFAANQSWHSNISPDLAMRRGDSTPHIDFNTTPRLQADTAAFPTTDVSFDLQAAPSAGDRGPASKGRAFAYPDIRGMQPGPESMTYSHLLRFPPHHIPTFTENEPVNLPPLTPYLPPRTDADTAEALYALYRTHCTSLIDSIRFCKEKQFFRLYTSFQGTLTVPVQKLFTHPNLATWIEQCDLVMYRTMVRFVSRLTLQAAPAVVINILSNISGNLHGHIAKTFASQPTHVLDAKLRPATVFAGLLYRLIRVNQAAHAAANLLTIDSNREQMWREWVTMVNPKRVMEAELPECGYEETFKILTSEMRNLLEPLQAPTFDDDPYGVHAYGLDAETGNFSSMLPGQHAQSNNTGDQSRISTENVLDRWSSFIVSLPTRFPQASARTLLYCISSIGTAALRDITIMNGLSYGHWWVLKIFVDEMALWLAEMGGFLEPTAVEMAPNGHQMFHPPGVTSGSERSQSGSRMSSAGAEGSTSHGQVNPALHAPHQSYFAPNGASATQSSQRRQPPSTSFAAAPFPSLMQSTSMTAQPQDPQKQPHPRHSTAPDPDIDDSGIGMSLMDEDLSFSKYGVVGPHMPAERLSGSELQVNTL